MPAHASPTSTPSRLRTDRLPSPSRGLLGLALVGLLGLGAGGCSSTGSDGSGGRGPAEPVRLGAGTLVVTEATRVVPGSYLVAPQGPRGETGVIRLEGLEGVTLDLSGVTLRGQPAGADLDTCEGYGVVLRRCKDVTVRGGELGGYRGCLVVEDCDSITIEGVTFDGWYGQRLRSTAAAEDPGDWLWPHENDQGQWLANYGAAIHVRDTQGLVLRDCRGRHGQNGVLLSGVRAAQVFDNDFSFLSGWGIGLWRSSGNVVSHNVFDYCVRGYSHDVYWRGQDSAGILIFESCSDNVFANNSATHGGDGVFLYAGHDLVEGRARDRGQEAQGCDRNVFWNNDLRFAVANSWEGTFSDSNVLVGNDLSGSHQHGVWGGYSSRLVLLDNRVANTLGGGVTIEHGQDCVLADNRFAGNEVAVELYWDDDEKFLEGPYGQQRDTASRDHWLLGNVFQGNDQDLLIQATTGLTIFGNRFEGTGERLYLNALSAEGDDTLGIETTRAWLQGPDGSMPFGHLDDSSLRPWEGEAEPDLLRGARSLTAPRVPGSQVVSAEARGEAKGGLETIVMGEWGPWDFRSGEPQPEVRRAGGLLSSVRWDGRWFRWDEDSDPRGDLSVWRALGEDPLVRREVPHLLDPWGLDDVRRQVGTSHFGLIAGTKVVLPETGRYRLRVVSDDGVRVMLDGETVIEDWSWHASKRDVVDLQLDAGAHELVVEYFQIDGAHALTLELDRMP